MSSFIPLRRKTEDNLPGHFTVLKTKADLQTAAGDASQPVLDCRVTLQRDRGYPDLAICLPPHESHSEKA